MANAERISISLSAEDRELITNAAEAAGTTVSAWMIHAAREEARWAVAQRIANEIAEEVGVTPESMAWAARVLGVELDD